MLWSRTDLQHACHSLQAHARIHVLGWQTLQSAISLAIELDEHQVPDLKNIGVICIQCSTMHMSEVVKPLRASSGASGVDLYLKARQHYSTAETSCASNCHLSNEGSITACE